MRDSVDVKMEIDDIYEDYPHDEATPEARAKIEALDWVLGQGDPVTGDGDGTGKFATEDEVKKAIESLKHDRENIPEFSLFGDPNWRMIDAQIEILQWVLK